MTPFSNMKFKKILELMVNSGTCSLKQPRQLLYHGEITFATPSKLELNMSQNHPLGVEKVTALAPFTFASWALSPCLQHTVNRVIYFDITK